VTLRRFIVRNALRNKRRTALTVLSVGFSLFLLIALTTFLDLLINPPMSEASARRLIVRRSTSLADMMPIAYGDKIRRVPHVVMAIPLQWFGGTYRDSKNMIGAMACGAVGFWDMFTEGDVSPETRKRFETDRTAAVIGGDLAKKFGWKVGDKFTLNGNLFPVDLEFTIAGNYEYELDNGNLYFRWDYLNEAMGAPNEVGSFWILADRPESVPGIADAVDATFRNTAAETKTETEKAFLLNFVSMLGNVRVLVGTISMVVIFTMLLVSVSTMAMTIRERMREVAILRAIGFARRAILFLVMGEAVFISLLGFALGCAITLSLRYSDIYSMTQGFIRSFIPPLPVYAMALAVGVAIGAVSGFIPAFQAARMPITEAMRKLE
jgi:putative ABC transport system permease protein